MPTVVLENQRMSFVKWLPCVEHKLLLAPSIGPTVRTGLKQMLDRKYIAMGRYLECCWACLSNNFLERVWWFRPQLVRPAR